MNESSWGAPPEDWWPQPGRPHEGGLGGDPVPADQQETRLLPPVAEGTGGSGNGDGFGRPVRPQAGAAWGQPWQEPQPGAPSIPGAYAQEGQPAMGGYGDAVPDHSFPPPPDSPSASGWSEQDRTATRLSGPLFRDETADSPPEATAILPPVPPGSYGHEDGHRHGNGHPRDPHIGNGGSGHAGNGTYGSGQPAATPGQPHSMQPPPLPPRPPDPHSTPPQSAGAPRHGQPPGNAPGPRLDPGPGNAQPGDRSGRKPKRKAGRNLKAAISVGVGLGAVIFASLFVFKVVFLAVVIVAVVVGLWELTTRLAERKELRIPLVPLAVGGTAMTIAGYVLGAEGAFTAMAFTVLALLVWRFTGPPDNYLRDVAAGTFTAFYVPFLASFVVLMLAADDGAWRVLTFLLLTVCSDTGAYAFGFRFGRRKLAPRISPGKTWEGVAGALALAMPAGALCLHFAVDGGTWWQGLIAGALVVTSATLGDLAESMIKRDLGIKDMGTLLPGHGGLMDRLDSMLPTAPVVWLFFVLTVGAG